MRSLRSVRAAPLLLSTLCALACLLAGEVARACGGFMVPPRPTEQQLIDAMPYLTQEQVLLAWDETTQTEHLIREVRFDRADKAFGFVVPVPTRPVVAKADAALFTTLRRSFAFEQLGLLGYGHGGGKGTGMGYGGGGGPPPVEVLEQVKVGSFTAFVLAAHDETGFHEWLEDNGLTTTSAVRAWLSRYVKLGFHFVAFRFEPPAGDGAPKGAKLDSEVQRISFETPVPFYPYREPEHRSAATQRTLTLWYVGMHPVRAVAAKTNGEELTWRRPWHEGVRHERVDDGGGEYTALKEQLPGWQAPPAFVQTFRDYKVDRTGFGDVLLVPEDPDPAVQLYDGRVTSIDPKWAAVHASMLAVIDPRLAPRSAETASGALAAEPRRTRVPDWSTPAFDRAACSAGAGGRGGGGGGAIVIVLGVVAIAVARARRLRPLLLAVLLGAPSACNEAALDRAPEEVPLPAGDARRLPDRDREAFALLAGHLLRGIEVEGGTKPEPPPAKRPPGVRPRVRMIESKVEAQKGADALPIVVVKRIVRANFPRLRACYEAARLRIPALEGEVGVSFEIDTTGAVENVKALPSGTGGISDAGMTGCVVGVFRTLAFPEPEKGSVTIAYTIGYAMED